MVKKLEFHKVANIFPLLEGKDYESFKVGVAETGEIKQPITLYRGKIIDGRNRYRVSRDLDIPCPSEKWNEEGSLTQFVVDLNENRRHMDTSQRAMAAARAKPHYAAEAKKRQRDHGNTAPGREKTLRAELPEVKGGRRARDDAAKAFSVGGRTVDYATKVIEKGSVELQKAVDKKEIPVSTAADIATLTNSEQKAVVKAAKAGDKKAVQAASRKARPRKKPTQKRKETPKLISDLLRGLENLIRHIERSTKGTGVQRERALLDLRNCRKRINESSGFLT